ncbi:prepilin-type N-terminal cleavage/methylation domain-containing protein [Candidatus Saccharibacteria bacterium]|nr:prepilin-type N-terminal cleavage/methylation domain-containing protein [Candidatus Saccharibacteria bacterium]
MKYKKGFTFVEVVLVLAIAGLIFSMTFIALPALWASQRDTDRREDVLGFISTLQKYQSNNSRGALPGDKTDTKKLSELENGISVIPEGDNNFTTTGGDTDTSWLSFYRNYFNRNTFVDPDGPYYTWQIMICQPGANNGDGYKTCANGDLTTLYNSSFGGDSAYKLYIVESAICYGGEAVYSNNARRVAALYRLEGGGVYCENT